MDMNVVMFIVVFVFVQLNLTTALIRASSGVISEDMTFIYHQFPVPPSVRAIIEVDVSYPINSIGMQGTDPVLGIYTTNSHINIGKECTQNFYGQLLNRELHPVLTTEDESHKLKCVRHNSLFRKRYSTRFHTQELFLFVWLSLW